MQCENQNDAAVRQQQHFCPQTQKILIQGFWQPEEEKLRLYVVIKLLECQTENSFDLRDVRKIHMGG